MDDIRFLVYDPQHFHAALVFKEMYPEVSNIFHVYAPASYDLRDFFQHIEGFNRRTVNPTSWDDRLGNHHGGVPRMLKDRRGNAVVLAGRNRDKIRIIHQCLATGLHVLADKPWVLSVSDLDLLQQALDLADEKGLIALDIMTERHEITTILQRELVNDPLVFGAIEPGSLEEPGVFMESVHSIKKMVAGSPLVRSEAFFDVEQQGEGLTDVGTHLVDLVPWVLFPGQAMNALRDLSLNEARRWPTSIPQRDFWEVSGYFRDPGLRTLAERRMRKKRGVRPPLAYFCNNSVKYCLRGIHVHLVVRWELQTASGTDWHHAVFRGNRASVEVRQRQDQPSPPELYLRPQNPKDLPNLHRTVEHRCRILENHYRDLQVVPEGAELRIVIPDRYRVGHEFHFGQVTRLFLDYVLKRRQLPGWEKANMLAKYRLTTASVHLARLGRGGI